MPYRDPKKKREYEKAYRARPEVRAKRLAYNKEYEARPKVKAAQNANKKQWKEQNPEKAVLYARHRSALLAEIKATAGCQICGEQDPVVLEFHHRNREDKNFNIGNGHSWSLEMVLTEIEKCEVLCANCHRREEWKLRQEKKDA